MDTPQPVPTVIESPYAGDIMRNIAYLKAAIRDSLSRGEAPFASHLFYTQPGVLNDRDPQERKLGITCNLSWILKANKIAVYTDLGVSEGMQTAINFAKHHSIPVEFRTLDLDLSALEDLNPRPKASKRSK